MYDVEFSEDRGGVVGQDHFLQMIDDDLISSVRAQGRLHRLRNGTTGIDVSKHGTIFAVVAVGLCEGV